jgi:AraC family transcriptional activator of mar-sox-rob regulon
MYWSLTLNLKDSSEWHSHGVYELLYCHRGNGRLLLDSNDIELQAGRFALILPKSRHKFTFEQGESANLKLLCLTPADIGVHLPPSLIHWLNKVQNTNVVYSDHEIDGELSGVLYQIPDALGESDKTDLDIIWGRIGLALALHFKNQKFNDVDSQGRYTNKVTDICSWIDNNLEENLAIDLISSQFGMSRSLLTKEFRKHTNTSVVEYINTRRLQKAGSLLSATDMSIAEVSLESGFPTLGNFYRKFKELYGVTPSEFKKQLENAKAIE